MLGFSYNQTNTYMVRFWYYKYHFNIDVKVSYYNILFSDVFHMFTTAFIAVINHGYRYIVITVNLNINGHCRSRNENFMTILNDANVMHED